MPVENSNNSSNNSNKPNFSENNHVVDDSIHKVEIEAKNKEIKQLQSKLASQSKQNNHAHKLQQALFKISELASGVEDLPDFYAAIHKTISDLIFADNFYIALVNEDATSLDLAYFVDSVDSDRVDVNTPYNIAFSDKSLSIYLYQEQQTLLLSSSDIENLEIQGKVKRLGPSACSWLGSPLISGSTAIGVIVVQSYQPQLIFENWHKDLFDYVSHTIASTLERKQNRLDLEHLVKLRTKNLQLEIEQHKKSKQTQSALYHIADLASKDMPLPKFYKALHEIVASMIYAENFYIALKNPNNSAMEMVYYVDTIDDSDIETIASIPMESIQKSISAYVMSIGEPLLVNEEEMHHLTITKKLDIHGPLTVFWLGIPLKNDGQVIGIMTLQSYLEEINLTKKDKELMTFVGQHVATALARNNNEDYLRLQVEKRTQELTISNQKLINEIAQRESSEKLQTALFKISETPQQCNSEQELYARLHHIISQLMYAESFYVTLVDKENQCFNFAYVVDTIDTSIPKSISMGNSLTGYVYRQRKTIHLNAQQIKKLEEKGEIENKGRYSVDWLGVPLLSGETIFGILILQSYDAKHLFQQKDIEIINFVSTHIAEALERSLAQKKLRFANKELAKKTMKAEAASEAKSSFLATVSHEIRTPMNGILGMLSLINETQLTEKQLDYITKISTSANSLLSIINDILDYSKIEEGKLELENIEFNLVEVVDNLVDIFSPQITEKRLLFNINLESDVTLVRIGDPLRLSQILINLIGNAVKFTDMGYINLSISSPSKNHLLFRVEDSGIGIASDKQSDIFDSFTQEDDTTTRKFGGSGLGLSICQQLVSMMKGWIKVSSTTDKGSCFSFEVYMQEKSSSSTKIKSAKNNRAFSKPMISKLENKDNNDNNNKFRTKIIGQKILLVEDNLINQQIAKEILQQAGAIVTVVENGLLAVEACNNNDFSLILMDIQMPIMDGHKASEAIRQKYPLDKLPIIAMTANAMKGDKEKCLQYGMNDYISKPINRHSFFDIIESYIVA